MEDDLPKIDRWHSEPLDVHTWSDHPEIKALCDDLYEHAGLSSLESKANRKAKRSKQGCECACVGGTGRAFEHSNHPRLH